MHIDNLRLLEFEAILVEGWINGGRNGFDVDVPPYGRGTGVAHHSL